jgi:protocatechuate 3,4-dioxygenase beta subunit
MNDYCRRAIAAMDAAAAGADPELQRRIAVVLKHLHAMIEELHATDAELYSAMGWLDQVGRDNDFIMLCDVSGLTMRCVDLTHQRPNATPANVEGPFPKDDVAWVDNPVALASPDEAGQRIELRGTVRSTTGTPVAGATFIVWQTNHRGQYENEDPSQPPDNFRARFRTLPDGGYSIFTVLPGPYEIGSAHGAVGTLMARLGRRRLRAAHLHYRVLAEGFEPLTSQMYFEGQPDNPTDCIFSQHPGITVPLLPHPQREGHLLGTYDIRLATKELP